MKKVTIGLSLAALAIGGMALAEQSSSPAPGFDATVSRAQMLERAGQMFDRLDVNKDGKLDQADREARRAAMFDRIDADHNGQISKAEFTAAWPPRGGPDGQIGGDGQGKPGTALGAGRGFGRGHGMGRMMMRMADSNHDGAVSRDEFMAAFAQHFDHMDANKDGQVTPAERQAMRQSMRSHMHDHGEPGMGAPGAPAPQGN